MDLVLCKDPLSLDLNRLYKLNWPYNLHFKNLLENQKVILWLDNVKSPKVAILFFRGSFHVLGNSESFDCGVYLSKLVRNLSDDSCPNFEIRVSSLPKNLVPKEIPDFSLVREVGCGLFYLHPKKFMPVEIKADIQSLNEDDAFEVVENTSYDIDDEYVLQCISAGPSVSIKKNKVLISYMLVHLNGSIGMLFTQEIHRRKGLASSIISRLTEKQIQKGVPVFCYIVNQNHNSRKVFERIGFERLGSVSWLKYERC
tara:strand:+ start:335 stop:1102 length:768 start_codon:yes stop_codon:yes gene_type:complete